MSKLHQMQITFAPVEDRLLFRINTEQRQEFRFWMTRRYVALLWKAILDHLRKAQNQGDEERDSSMKATEGAAPSISTATEPIRDALLAREHEQHVANSDFKTQFQESNTLPLGEQPLLLSGIGLKQTSPGSTILCIHPHQGEGIEISLNEQITHSLCRLVAEATRKADWNLDLEFSQASRYFTGNGEPDNPGLN